MNDRRKEYLSLVDRHAPILRALVRRVVSDPHQVDDVLQEIAIRFMLYMERKFVNIREPVSYLNRVALNVARNYTRRNGKPELSLDDIDSSILQDPTDGPEEHVYREQRREQLLSAIARLPEACRQVVRLIKLEGMTYKEAAKIRNCTVSTLEQNYTRAIKWLSQMIPPDTQPQRTHSGGSKQP